MGKVSNKICTIYSHKCVHAVNYLQNVALHAVGSITCFRKPGEIVLHFCNFFDKILLYLNSFSNGYIHLRDTILKRCENEVGYSRDRDLFTQCGLTTSKTYHHCINEGSFFQKAYLLKLNIMKFFLKKTITRKITKLQSYK